MSGSCRLDVHGVGVELRGDAHALQALALHFAPYVVERGPAPDVRVELRRGAPRLDALGRLRADQVFERGVVYNRGATVLVDHHGRATTEYDFAAERGSVCAAEHADLVELGYLLVHSRLGPLLERRGLVRLHALGVCRGERAAVVLAPSGGGKSTLARALLARPGVELLGDDMVLVDAEGRAHPFHAPLGLTDPAQAGDLGEPVAFARRHHPAKWIVPLDRLAHRLRRTPAPIAHVFALARVSAPPSRIQPCSRRAAAAWLFRDMVVGLGLPQVIELVARRGLRDAPAQLPALARRTRTAAAVLRRAQFAVLEQADVNESAGLLIETLSA